jgi:nucleoid-associated protein YgaU
MSYAYEVDWDERFQTWRIINGYNEENLDSEVPITLENGQWVTRTVLIESEASNVDDGSMQPHTVMAGETLRSISEKFYGNEAAYGVIFNANASILKTPDKLDVGMVLKIPTKNW